MITVDGNDNPIAGADEDEDDYETVIVDENGNPFTTPDEEEEYDEVIVDEDGNLITEKNADDDSQVGNEDEEVIVLVDENGQPLPNEVDTDQGLFVRKDRKTQMLTATRTSGCTTPIVTSTIFPRWYERRGVNVVPRQTQAPDC